MEVLKAIHGSLPLKKVVSLNPPLPVQPKVFSCCASGWLSVDSEVRGLLCPLLVVIVALSFL